MLYKKYFHEMCINTFNLFIKNTYTMYTFRLNTGLSSTGFVKIMTYQIQRLFKDILRLRVYKMYNYTPSS